MYVPHATYLGVGLVFVNKDHPQNKHHYIVHGTTKLLVLLRGAGGWLCTPYNKVIELMMVMSAPILRSLLWTDQRLFQRRRLEGERDEEMRQLLLAVKSEHQECLAEAGL